MDRYVYRGPGISIEIEEPEGMIPRNHASAKKSYSPKRVKTHIVFEAFNRLIHVPFQGQAHVTHEERLRKREESFLVEPTYFLDNEKANELISHLFVCEWALNLPQQTVREIADHAARVGRKIPDMVSTKRKDTVVFKLTVKLVHTYMYDENEDRRLGQPASRAAVDALEKRVYDGEKDAGSDGCVICFDDFEKGKKEMTVMPCSHVYHEHCIKKWLGMRNFCPICHYEMPVDE